jgi:hypothetical protein
MKPFGLLLLLLILPPPRSPAASPPPDAPPPTEIVLGEHGAVYVARVRQAQGALRLRLRVRPIVRSVDFRILAPPAQTAAENTVTLVDLVTLDPAGSTPPGIAFRGRVTGRPDPQATGPGIWRLFTAQAGLSLREEDLRWELRFETVRPSPQAPKPPLDLFLRVSADARPITDRERELMAWRRGVPDPLQAVGLVRAKVAELTDAEIQYYTNFPNRAAFLKFWGTTRREHLRGPSGELTITPENQGLFSSGRPLPDGKFLHHNGRLPALD